VRYLLDTNTCIAVMRRVPLVVTNMAATAPLDCAVSTVTAYELFTGVAKCSQPLTEGPKVAKFLQTVGKLAFGMAAAKKAAEIRAQLEATGQTIGPYDLLLAGHASSLGLTLVTANTREFSRVVGLTLTDWTK
jgi:tRNA(fMet)-specific endonuclease VapC